MAMLAEPRRKQKIGPNPRGLFFTEDDQNRGRTMLQKLGWKDGRGLGRADQGISEPIKPKVQQNSKGLGFDVKSDPWIAHNDKFSELLQNLNSTTDGEKHSGDDRLELEKKSKSSRSRIHYQKFVRNKDLSKCSSKDWECIFGKSVDAKSCEKVNVKPVAEDVEEIEEVVTLKDKFISGGSMLDYFKQKFEQKYKKAQTMNTDRVWEKTETNMEKPEIDSEKIECESEEPIKKNRKNKIDVEPAEGENEELLKKKKKDKSNVEKGGDCEETKTKRKKHKIDFEKVECESEEPSKKNKIDIEHAEGEKEELLKKKKKDKSNVEKEGDCGEKETKRKKHKIDTEKVECENEEPIKKKKKNKIDVEPAEGENEELLKKKKKDKSNVEKEGDCEKTKTKRKKHKIDSEKVEYESEEPITKNKVDVEPAEGENEKVLKRKKKDKSNLEKEGGDEPLKNSEKNETEAETPNCETEEKNEAGSPENDVMRGRRKIWDEETVKHIASKYIGSNVLSIPGYPLC